MNAMAIELYLPFFAAIPFFFFKITCFTRSVKVSKMLTAQQLSHSTSAQQIVHIFQIHKANRMRDS